MTAQTDSAHLDPFVEYKLDDLANIDESFDDLKNKSLRAKFFILSLATYTRKKIFTKPQVVRMFNNVIEELDSKEAFEKFLFFDESRGTENSLITDEEKVIFFQKFMDKWITGNDVNSNYFVLNFLRYYELMKSKKDRKFFCFSKKPEMKKIFFSALERQIEFIIKIPNSDPMWDEVHSDLELWCTARKILSMPKFLKNSLFLLFNIESGHHESTRYVIRITTHLLKNKAYPFDQYLMLISSGSLEFGMLDSITRDDLTEQKNELQESFISAIGKFEKSDLGRLKQLRKSLIDIQKSKRVYIEKEKSCIDEKIISFCVNQ